MVMLSYSCENDIAKVRALVPEDEINKEIAEEVEMIYSDSAVVRVRIRGGKMFTYKEGKQTLQEFPEGIAVDFFDERQRIQSKLTANYAIRYDGKKEILIRDNVVWKSETPETLETEELIWSEKDAKVYSKRFVKITTPNDVLYGYGFEAEEDFSKWQITAPQGEIGVDQ